MEENEYRQAIQKVYSRIADSLEDVDPDVVECEQSMGAMTLIFSDRSKCILSAQPSVRQLWLAMASRGVAFHFIFDPSRGIWLDDKGQGLELLSLLEKHIHDISGVPVKLEAK